MRTIGFPIALAAHGYPLRSPYAVDVVLPYPIGAFVFTSGHIALLPSLALHFLIADTVSATLFYSFVVLIVSAVIVQARIVQFLIAASGLISVTYNLSCGLKPRCNRSVVLVFSDTLHQTSLHHNRMVKEWR